MSDSPAEQTRYWLLIGDVPQGPFDVAQVHDKLASGEATGQTQACPVGGSTWLPLVQTPGLGPSRLAKEPATGRPASPPIAPRTDQILDALPVKDELPVSSLTHPVHHLEVGTSDPSARNPPKPEGKPAWGGIVAAVLLFGLLGWLGYSWLRPLTPREVCECFDRAKTAQEAKRYCTLNMHSAVDALHRQKLPESDDPSEYTQEGDAPPGIGGYFVGVRSHQYVPEERRRIQVDGVIHLIQSDGWKIEDFYILSIDRQQLPEPISLARNPQLLGDSQPGANPPNPPNRPATAQGSSTKTTQAKAWYEDRAVQYAAGRGLTQFFASGGGKALGMILVAAVLALFRFGKEILEMVSSGTRR